MLLSLTLKSLKTRRIPFLLSVFSIAISLVLLLGVNRAIQTTKNHFINTINQTDLVVASSNGSLDILLNLLFHISEPLGEMNFDSFESIAAFSEVKWAVPLSLGDSFKGYGVVSTNPEYFTYYRYSDAKSLSFYKGRALLGFYDIVLGYDVAKSLKLHLGSHIHLSHGSSSHTHTHTNREFKVVGILNKTLTPNDATVFMQLKADEAIHLEWQSGHFVDMHISDAKLQKMKIKPKHISGVLLGLKNRVQILEVQEKIKKFKQENLNAVIPAKALSKLYTLMKNMQELLNIISIALFIVALMSMLSFMYATLTQRTREMAILRTLGASSALVFKLFALEAFITLCLGILLGLFFLNAGIFILSFFLSLEFSYAFSLYEFFVMALMLLFGVLIALLPAFKLYSSPLNDSLSVKN